MKSEKPSDIDEYIASFPGKTQERMSLIRALLKEIAPQGEEAIAYDMAAMKLNGSYIAYYAGFKNHIGLYPGPPRIPEFDEVFKNYKTGKGSVQFPLDRPMPRELIKRILAYNLRENRQRTGT